MKLFIDPHGDDGVLFGAFTIMKERPLVLVVFDSYIQTARGAQGCDPETRKAETIMAIHELEWPPQWPEIIFLGFRDDGEQPTASEVDHAIEMAIGRGPVEEIWAPAYEEGGHEQHNLVAKACDAFEGSAKVHRYLTYTRNDGKTRQSYRANMAKEVLPCSGEDIARKHRALACFKSQMQLDPRIGCADWFLGDLREYALLTPSQSEVKP